MASTQHNIEQSAPSPIDVGAHRTPGPWAKGKQGGSVVAPLPRPSETCMAISTGDASHLEYYGGHMVAESIAPGDVDAIVAAADYADVFGSMWFKRLEVQNDHTENPVFATSYAVFMQFEPGRVDTFRGDNIAKVIRQAAQAVRTVEKILGSKWAARS